MKKSSPDSRPAVPVKRKIWTPPRLERVGNLHELIRGGGGKLSITGGDPGESRKPSGQG